MEEKIAICKFCGKRIKKMWDPFNTKEVWVHIESGKKRCNSQYGYKIATPRDDVK